MDQERDIEKLLRAAAERRQKDAGLPLELHPADRRLLHQEIARRFGQSKSAPTQGLWLGRAWPKLALTFGLILLLGIGAGYWLYTSTQSRPGRITMTLASDTSSARDKSDAAFKKEVVSAPTSTAPITTYSDKLNVQLADNARSEASKDQAYSVNRAQSPQPAAATRQTAPSSVASTPAPAAPPTASTPALAAAPTAAPAGSLSAPTLVENSAAAPSAAGEPRSLLGAKQAVVDATEAQSLQRSLTMAPSSINGATASNQSQTFTFGYAAQDTNSVTFLDAKSLALRQRFIQSPGTVGLDGRIAAPAARTPLLASFELSQSDGKVTIVDADGSVYNGYAQPADPVRAPATPTAAASPRLAMKSASAQSAPAPIQNRSFSGGAATSGSAATEGSWFFRVTGTNITSNQWLIFDGNLAVVPGATITGDSAATPSNATDRLKAPATARAAITNYQISGKAQLGGSNTFEVQAVSAPSSH
jgi:hypothetical protein